MPSLTLLRPTVLNGVIAEIEPPQELVGLSLMETESHPFPTVLYDVTRGSRTVAKPNVPNSEAHIVPKLKTDQLAAGYSYVREKKVFEPTTMYWLRREGTLATKKGEEAVMRELQDLDRRLRFYQEWTIWRGLFTGRLQINEPDVKVNVDYGMADSHRPVLAGNQAWDYTDGDGKYVAPIRQHVNAWKKLVSRDGAATITDAYMNSDTRDIFMRNVLFEGGANSILSDRQKESLYSEGFVDGLLGLKWNVYDLAFDDGTGTHVPYIPDGYVALLAKTNRPWVMLEGPAADFAAPADHTGKFSKTWQEQDPSARQALLECNFFPALYRPDQVVYAKVY